ncbi:hypothetical protein RFD10_000512 [Klebsiella aerogenes]|nr:hypothetical protein [Klebsiella aerogenes]
MTDITRLLASLKRRSSHVKEFGDDITFVKLEDLDALVEALEKAQQLETKDAEMVIQISKRLAEAYKRIAELESRTVTVKLPADRAAESEVSGYDGTEFYRTGWNARGKADKEALTAQGIKWEAE